ncbi:hypothetical protein Q3G72_004712 [Acer saccharum]|nr:hypothetical protein Q3G72_004712 [Acer saccharum]
MKRPPPTPREIRHFYSLRQLGKSGIYFLYSTKPEHWIPKDVEVCGQVESTTDEKMKKVPRYFCSLENWNRATPTYTDSELVALARATVRPSEKIGKPYLYRESKMIKAHLFPQISDHRRRLYDVDIACDVQARQMNSVVEASQKEVLHQEETGIVPPESDSDESSPEDTPKEEHNEGIPEYTPQETRSAGEEVGESYNVPRDAELVREPLGAVPSKFQSLPNQFLFHLPRVSNLRDPAFDVAAAASQSFDGAGGPSGTALTSVPESTGVRVDVEVENPASGLDTRGRQSRKRKASFSPGRSAPKIPRVVAYVDSSSGDEETDVRAEYRLFPSPPKDHAETRAGGFDGPFPQAQTSTVMPPTGAGAGGPSLPSQPGDPTPQSMLKAMSSGHTYIGEDHWSRLRVGTPSDRLCSFFNNASYMVAEMSKAYRTGEAQEDRIKRLEAQLKKSEDRRARAELACQEGVKSNQVLLDQYLACQMEAEQKASFAAEEAKTLQDQLSSTQDALLQAEQNAEDAKSSYDRRIEDLERQALTVRSLSKEARLELEIQGVDHFKRSPAYDALLLQEFQRGMVSAGEFFGMKNRTTDRARANWSLFIKKACGYVSRVSSDPDEIVASILS